MTYNAVKSEYQLSAFNIQLLNDVLWDIGMSFNLRQNDDSLDSPTPDAVRMNGFWQGFLCSLLRQNPLSDAVVTVWLRGSELQYLYDAIHTYQEVAIVSSAEYKKHGDRKKQALDLLMYLSAIQELNNKEWDKTHAYV